jgi:hypothetical protein
MTSLPLASSWLLGLLLCPEDGSSVVLRNIGEFLLFIMDWNEAIYRLDVGIMLLLYVVETCKRLLLN